MVDAQRRVMRLMRQILKAGERVRARAAADRAHADRAHAQLPAQHQRDFVRRRARFEFDEAAVLRSPTEIRDALLLGSGGVCAQPRRGSPARSETHLETLEVQVAHLNAHLEREARYKVGRVPRQRIAAADDARRPPVAAAAADARADAGQEAHSNKFD